MAIESNIRPVNFVVYFVVMNKDLPHPNSLSKSITQLAQEIAQHSYKEITVVGSPLSGKKEVHQRLQQLLKVRHRLQFGAKSGVLRIELESDLITALVRRRQKEYPLRSLLDAYKAAPEEKCEYLLANHLSANETALPHAYSIYERFLTNKEDYEQCKKILGTPIQTRVCSDYFFCSKYLPDHQLRVRLLNGSLFNVTYFSPLHDQNDGKHLFTQLEVVDEKEIQTFSKEELLSKLAEAGLSLFFELYQEQRIWQQEGVIIEYIQAPFAKDFIELRSEKGVSKTEVIEKIKTSLKFDSRPAFGQWEALCTQNYKSGTEEAKACTILGLDQKGKAALQTLRRGYPDQAISQQCRGAEFREAAKTVMQELAKEVVHNKSKIILPWQAGLAWLPALRSILPASSFCQVEHFRDAHNLENKVKKVWGSIGIEDEVVLVEPMLATGDTVRDLIIWLKEQGVAEKNIQVLSVLAAPEGIKEISHRFPLVRLYAASLEEGIDQRGYIRPGLGDFAGKYFYALTATEMREWLALVELPSELRPLFLKTLGQHSLGEMVSKLVVRDGQDAEIARTVYSALEAAGLSREVPLHRITLDTGMLDSIKEVTEVIKSEVERLQAQIITIEGLSGTGKGSTAEELQKNIPAWNVSLGQIYRYLAFCSLGGEQDFPNILKRLHYVLNEDSLSLYDGSINIAQQFRQELRAEKLEKIVVQVAAVTQTEVISFLKQFLQHYSKDIYQRPLVIEGRAHNLDFLPSDLRVALIADPSIRAERRWGDYYSKPLLAP